jgi:hypothetical protein
MSLNNPDYPFSTLPELIKRLSENKKQTKDEKDTIYYLQVYLDSHPWQPELKFDSTHVIKQSSMNFDADYIMNGKDYYHKKDE